jgi:DNA-binding transcriptional ArsR family regulator
MSGLNRVFFTGGDLANVRVAGHFGPLAETAFSLERLLCPAPSVVFDPWRRRLGPRVDGGVQALARLFPWTLDLGTVSASCASLDEGLERFRGRSSRLVASELDYSAASAFDPPDWAGRLVDREPRQRVAGALRSYHAAAIEPYWPAALQILEAETQRAARRLGELGVEGFLGSLGPEIRWRRDVLEVQCPARFVHDCRLDGRGLEVVPSLFCPAGFPLCMGDDPDAPYILFYPLRLGPGDVARLWALDRRPAPSLVALLGRTRAAVLDIVATQPCTTSELARRGGMSASSASEHASVLRAAGLVTSERRGSAVVHTATALGLQLLGGGWHDGGHGRLDARRGGQRREGEPRSGPCGALRREGGRGGGP